MTKPREVLAAEKRSLKTREFESRGARSKRPGEPSSGHRREVLAKVLATRRILVQIGERHSVAERRRPH